jgi:hypothetical protein
MDCDGHRVEGQAVDAPLVRLHVCEQFCAGVLLAGVVRANPVYGDNLLQFCRVVILLCIHPIALDLLEPLFRGAGAGWFRTAARD